MSPLLHRNLLRRMRRGHTSFCRWSGRPESPGGFLLEFDLAGATLFQLAAEAAELHHEPLSTPGCLLAFVGRFPNGYMPSEVQGECGQGAARPRELATPDANAVITRNEPERMGLDTLDLDTAAERIRRILGTDLPQVPHPYLQEERKRSVDDPSYDLPSVLPFHLCLY